MNGQERIALAMQGKAADRVPVMCQLALGHYFLNTDIPPHRVWFSSEGFAEALVSLQCRYRFDGIVINLPGRPDNLFDDVTSIEETKEGELLHWKNGDATLIPWDDNAQHRMADGSEPSRADFAAIDPDNLDALDKLTGYIWGIYHIPRLPENPSRGLLTEIPPYFFRTIDLVKQMVGEEVSVQGEVFSPFTHFVELFGYENALMNLLMDGGKAHTLLDRLTETSISWGVAQAKRGVDAVLLSSAFAGGPFLSRAMYKEFVLPYERRLTEALKTTAVPIYTHTCGSIGDRLDLMVETGTQGIDTLDPPPLGNADLAAAKAQIGDKVFIKGNMNGVELLAMQDRDDVLAHASERIRIGKPGGGYILSTACSVPPKMEPWKLELLTPLAEEIGKY